MKFTIIKSCLARFSGTFAVGTPSNIHGTALSYRCAKFGAFVNSVTILTLRDLTIGTLIHRITFDSISNANSYQMSAKTTRKLSRVFYSSLSTNDYFKDYLNKPVACINAIFISFVVSYYGYRKK